MRPLLVAQFLGAFNDNAWKLFFVVLAGRALAAGDEAGAQQQAMLAMVVFTLPLMLCSLPAGALADRLSKRTVILGAKLLEAVLMAAGALLLVLNPHDTTGPLVVLGLMGVQSALFSPAKYGIVPQLVPHERLSAANGALEMWTFFAIIAGTALGPEILDKAGRPAAAAAILALLACAGFVAARGIPRVPAAGGRGDSIGAAWRAIRADRALWLAVLGAAYFWGVTSLLGQNMLVYARSILGLSEQYTGYPLAVFGVGVGLGSFLAGRLSHDKVETGLIPLGALGLGVLVLLLGLFMPGLFVTLCLLAAAGVASGFLIVPLDALLQWLAPPERRGAVIALSNVFVFGGVLVGSLAGGFMAGAGFSTRGILLGAAVVTLAGTVWAVRTLPVAFLRLLAFLYTNTVYRIKVVGLEHVPQKGGVLLTPNHVSFMDGLFVIAALDRPVRFLVDKDQFARPLLRPFLKVAGAIPVSSGGTTKDILRALRAAGDYLDQGEVVCIFPEGQITRTGQMQPFRRGLQRIVKGRKAPIVPVHLDRVWGSIFSFKGKKFVWKLPEGLPYALTVSFGEPLPPGTPVHEIRDRVRALGERAWRERERDRPPLHRTFIRIARRRPFRLAMGDMLRPKVSRFGALMGAIALGRALRPHWEGQERVGILLPPSVAGALVNVAASMAGRASVNLNYTAGKAGMESAVRQAGLRTVVTSRRFLDKAQLDMPDGATPLWLEDMEFSRLPAALLALLAPKRWIERACGAARRPRVGDLVTVIFSSGSTGEPKGVMLTHFNIDSNVEAVAQVFRLEPQDRLLGILPLFHSFGTLLLWCGLNYGVPIIFFPNPVDGPAIGKLVLEHKITLLVATPTFLQVYLRRCAPEQFGSLRIVMAGAEKLPDRLVEAFQKRFGIQPLEGYGTTECAPVIAASVPSFRAPGFFQPGARRGYVGPPLPGVAVRIVDPDTFEPLPLDTPGLLLVRGPNVMRGYLGREDLTREAFHEGWYVTGDIAVLDEEGFLRITDRLSRFSKIGGEMVPHGVVEEALHEAYGEAGVFAVTAVPDAKKGERLAVLHTIGEEEIEPLLAKLDVPNLFRPRPDSFVKVDEIPVLGTGKTDLRAVKRIAAKALG